MNVHQLFNELPLSIVRALDEFKATKKLQKPFAIEIAPKHRPNLFILNEFNKDFVLQAIQTSETPFHFYFQKAVTNQTVIPDKVRHWMLSNSVLFLLLIICSPKPDTIVNCSDHFLLSRQESRSYLTQLYPYITFQEQVVDFLCGYKMRHDEKLQDADDSLKYLNSLMSFVYKITRIGRTVNLDYEKKALLLIKSPVYMIRKLQLRLLLLFLLPNHMYDIVAALPKRFMLHNTDKELLFKPISKKLTFAVYFILMSNVPEYEELLDSDKLLVNSFARMLYGSVQSNFHSEMRDKCEATETIYEITNPTMLRKDIVKQLFTLLLQDFSKFWRLMGWPLSIEMQKRLYYIKYEAKWKPKANCLISIMLNSI